MFDYGRKSMLKLLGNTNCTHLAQLYSDIHYGLPSFQMTGPAIGIIEGSCSSTFWHHCNGATPIFVPTMQCMRELDLESPIVQNQVTHVPQLGKVEEPPYGKIA